MSVVGDPLPGVDTLLGVIDTEARATANRVRTTAVPVVRAALPSRSGRARRGTTGRVNRTATGYSIEVAGSSRVRYPSGVTAKQVIGWLHTGTGVFGPLGRPIKPRHAAAFRLPSGWVSGTIDGFPGHDYFGAAERALDGGVIATLEAGADRAARAVERVLS